MLEDTQESLDLMTVMKGGVVNDQNEVIMGVDFHKQVLEKVDEVTGFLGWLGNDGDGVGSPGVSSKQVLGFLMSMRSNRDAQLLTAGHPAGSNRAE
jgi:hypothetical protein